MTNRSERPGWWKRWWLVVLVALAGVGAIYVGQSHRVAEFKLGWFGVGALVEALGEALTVAAALALLVDRRVKVDLAREVSDNMSSKTAEVFYEKFLGGHELPREYLEGVAQLNRTDVVSIGAEFSLVLEWAPERTYLQVTSVMRNSLTNVSDADSQVPGPWIVSFRDGRPPSRITRYEVQIQPKAPAAGYAGSLKTIVWKDDQLRSWNDEVGRDGWITTGESVILPAHTKGSYVIEGISYHSPASIMPLGIAYPTLGRSLMISGDALDDLDVSVGVGRKRLRPELVDAGGSPALRYENRDLAFGGSTIIVLWSPKIRPSAKPDVSQVTP